MNNSDKYVICKSRYIPHLTYGKSYRVLFDSWRHYYLSIKNNEDKVLDYSKESFRDPTKDELREIRLNKETEAISATKIRNNKL